jgi:transposase
MPPTTDPAELRRLRGQAIADLCRITRQNGQWLVPSQTGNGVYRVTLRPPSPAVPMCTCDDFAKRGEPCKHVHAARLAARRQEWSKKPTTQSPARLMARATAERKTYKQDWPAYNAAQINEKAKFQEILRDLCGGVPEPEPGKKGGRPPVPMADRAFACAFKVYSTVSGRRASCDIADARDKGHISRAPHYSSVSRYLEDPGMTPILRALIARSSLPLRSIETDFAVDSSGFSTSRFVRWFDHKYGRPTAEYDWVKVHLITGVKTNIVTAAAIGERNDGDSPHFAPLVGATAERFTIGEVSADAAYLSYDNMQAVAGHGGTPFILFKSNSTGAGGGVFGRMFHLYQYHRDDFLAHYHKRSNAESTFSMVKAKFGDSLRSKTDAAMVNEALCKILCHNVCVLIQSAYELGIEATFWRRDRPMDAAPEGDEIAGEDLPEIWAWV